MLEQALVEIQKGWTHWHDGKVPQAQIVAEQILQTTPADQEALHLQALTQLVQGRYAAALNTFSKLDTSYTQYPQVGGAMVEAYLHLNDLERAVQLTRKLNLDSVAYLESRLAKPFRVKADDTSIIPFSDDPKISASFWPGIAGRINGQDVNIRLDTGGSFLILEKQRAEQLGIALIHQGKSTHAASQVTSWKGIADEMQLGGGPCFEHVPVVIMESLGTHAIFGTNILEPFLATMDYPNSRFILTPRHRKELYKAHLDLLPKNQRKLPFYMWGDHYMFAKGGFNNIDDLTFFFDSGLIALTEIDGKLKQAAFTVSKQKLTSWGFSESQLEKTSFLPTQYPLSVAGLHMANTLIWYDENLPHDRNFGGVRMDGLISHAFLSNYSWTINFDKYEYLFGIE
jgi:tetratricopeptide (TPR) repeat protein